MTLLEIAVSLAIVSTVMLGVGRAFSTSLEASSKAQRMTDGLVFLETVMTDLSAQSYDGLLAVNGNQIFDGNTLATSEFSVQLTTFTVAVDLVQVDALLADRETGRIVASVSTQRSRP